MKKSLTNIGLPIFLFAIAVFIVPYISQAFTMPQSGAVTTGNELFPYTVSGATGKNFVSKDLPKAGEYSAPLRFVGRYFDGYPHGGWTTSMGFYWRFLSGGEPTISSASRVYVRLGSTIVAYNKSNFIQKLGSNSLSLFKGTYVPQYGYSDAVLPWDSYFYPEEGTANGWLQENCDCNANMRSFDADDRGYIYLAHLFGIGIIRDNGAILAPVSQIRGIEGLTFSDGPKTLPFFMNGSHGTNKITDAGGAGSVLGTPSKVRVLKSGTQYYLVSQDSSNAHLLNVTDPMNPAYIRALSGEGSSKANIVQSGGMVAVQKADSIKVYTVQSYADGLTPTKEYSAGAGKYFGLAGDGAGKFFSISYAGKTRNSEASVSVISSTTEQKYKVGTWSEARSLEYGSGYLTAIITLTGASAEDAKIWSMASGTPVEINTNGFLKNYYDVDGALTNVSVESITGKAYLFISTNELSDVYELGASAGPTGGAPDTGCSPGNVYSTTTGNPCACEVRQFAMGARGEDVKVLQQKLRDAGIYRGNVDGIYGPLTSAAEYSYCRSVLYPKYQPLPVQYNLTSAPPVISDISGPTSLGVNEMGTWIAKGTDANGDDLSWSVNWGEGRSVQFCALNPKAGTLQNSEYNISHSWATSGKYTVTVHATDCKGGSTSKAFTVTVR